jgi:hypothetical protein
MNEGSEGRLLLLKRRAEKSDNRKNKKYTEGVSENWELKWEKKEIIHVWRRVRNNKWLYNERLWLIFVIINDLNPFQLTDKYF